MIRRYIIIPAWRIVIDHARERYRYWREPFDWTGLVRVMLDDMVLTDEVNVPEYAVHSVVANALRQWEQRRR